MSVLQLLPEFVEQMPDELLEGVLYVSIPFRTSVHLCACGCGQEVWMPIRPDRHHLTWDGESVSITPSVGNWGLRCQAHYWVHRSQVVWVPEPAQDGDAGGGGDDHNWLRRELDKLWRRLGAYRR